VLVALAAVGGLSVRERLSPAVAAPSQTLYITCPSPSLGGSLPAAVYLPQNYDAGEAHYPVVYFLHGLPAGPMAYKLNGYVAGAVAASGHAAIVVAPQGSRKSDDDREYLEWGPRENWPKVISHDLTTSIDSRFRTIANRHGRALVGVSAGGFGAFNIGLRELSVFSVVESWSGYFAATDPSGDHVLKLGSKEADREARIRPAVSLAAAMKRLPSLVGFYVGRQDQRFYSDNTTLNLEWSAAHVPHLFATYPGGHSLSVWAKWAPLWLGRALAYLRAPA
jgi:putative tributyrin esterase